MEQLRTNVNRFLKVINENEIKRNKNLRLKIKTLKNYLKEFDLEKKSHNSKQVN